MNQISINKDLCTVGLRVVRGPHWEWGDQDGGMGAIGTITQELCDNGWVSVTWDKGGTRDYRVGVGGRYDLALYNPFISKPMKLTDSTLKKLQNLRQTMTDSIERANSLIEKSNTKHGNSNTSRRVSVTSTGAIKVRRSTSKIKGSEGRRS